MSGAHYQTMGFDHVEHGNPRSHGLLGIHVQSPPEVRIGKMNVFVDREVTNNNELFATTIKDDSTSQAECDGSDW